jgi:murein DD-endopeptidase MepM/ murein hydrolase activator NlpD
MSFGADLLNQLESTKDWKTIRNILLQVNSNYSYSEGKFFNDQVNLSSIGNLRRIIDTVSKPAYREKEEYLGIVLDSEEVQIGDKNTTLEIYVDVPGVDFEFIDHPDDVSNFGFEFEKVSHKIFYPETPRVLETDYPSPGDIVRVKIPPNFFISSLSNPTEMKYLGIFLKVNPINISPDGLSPEDQEKLLPENRIRSLYRPQNRPEGAIEQSDYITEPFWSSYYIDPSGKKIDYKTPKPWVPISSFTADRATPPNVKKFLQSKGSGSNKSKTKVGFHDGLDIATITGTEVLAPFDMEIISSRDEGVGGLCVRGITKKYLYVFAHLSKLIAVKGQTVKKGQVLGLSGDTGSAVGAPHIHFAIYTLGTPKRAINSLYFFKFDMTLTKDLQQGYNLPSIIKLPLEFRNYDNTSQPPTQQATAGQPSTSSTGTGSVSRAIKDYLDLAKDEAQKPNMSVAPRSQSRNMWATNGSLPVNRPKMLLVDFPVDKSEGIRDTNKLGAKQIVIREDLVKDVTLIKEKLNQYNIPLTCESLEISLKNENISLLAKVGLEINLNRNSALTTRNNLVVDDYFVGPDYSSPLGNGYKLIVYGNVKRNIDYYDEQFRPEKKVIDVYDARERNANGTLKIKKILKNVLNITELFEKNGFIAVLPRQDFFNNGDIAKSNWNKFQKPAKITVGYTYNELLQTVYRKNNEPIWRLPDIKWDGSKFV